MDPIPTNGHPGALPAKSPARKTKRKKQSRAVTVHAPAPPPAPKNFLQVIMTAATDPACDVAKMQALLDMQRQIEERDARKAFTVAFNALQAELPIINRDGNIDHSAEGTSGRTRSGRRALQTRYATYPNLNRAVGPLLKAHGFTYSTSVEPAPDGTMFVISTLEHIAGANRTTRFKMLADTTGGKNNQQGWGSSQQYGMRYNMIALLNIVSEAPQDADNDGFPEPTTLSPAQAEELAMLLRDAGGNLQKFCEAFEVEGIAQIPAGSFDEAKRRIAAYKVAKTAAKERTKLAGDFPGDRV